MKPNNNLRILLALAGSSLLAMSSARAQSTLYFDGTPTTPDGASSGGTGTWNTTNLNWDNGTSYVAWNNANGDNAVVTGGATIAIGVPITVGTLTFTSSGVAGRTISGSEITINGGMSFERLSSLNWTAPIRLGGNQTWTHNQLAANSTGKNIQTGGTNLDGRTLTWDTTNAQSNNRITHSTITGTGSIIKDGTGWLGLSGTNTYTGSTTINAGTIDMASSTALGNINNNLTVNTGGTLNIAGNFGLTVGNLTGTGGVITTSSGNTNTRTLTIGSGDATGGNFQGQISQGNAPIALTKTGTGTITLSGANTYTGNTTVSAGTLTLAASSSTQFQIGASQVNNAVLGTGTVNFNGLFVFDLTSASTNSGDFWEIVDVGSLNESYGSTFGVSSTLGAFTDNAGVWSLVDGGNAWTFTEGTGILGLTVIPEPSAALLGGLGLLALLRRRR